MQTISLPWLTYTLTHSPFLLGLVGAVQFMPSLLFSLFAGAMLDRLDKKRIIIITQASLTILAAVLAALVYTKQIEFIHILIISFLIGLANSFDMPARQSYVIEMVGKEDLMNAIGLNSAIFNLARIFGPAAAGFIMELAGMELCFFINALSFLPVITGLFFIRTKPGAGKSKRKSGENIIKDISEGLKYICSVRSLFWTLGGVLIVGTFAMNFNVLVPIFAKTVLAQKESGFGTLMSCMGVGSLAGALAITIRSKKGPSKIIFGVMAFSISIVMILTGMNRLFSTTAIGLALAGFTNVVFFTTANSALQINSRDSFRGRVMSVYMLLNAGTTPIGNLFVGTISGLYGASSAFIACGAVIIVLFSILLLFYRKSMSVSPA